MWRITIACTAILFTTSSVLAQLVPSEQSLSGLYPGKAYSPYAQRSFPDRVFWGDTHLHTNLSADAGLLGGRLGLDEAYGYGHSASRVAVG